MYTLPLLKINKHKKEGKNFPFLLQITSDVYIQYTVFLLFIAHYHIEISFLLRLYYLRYIIYTTTIMM